MLLAESYIHRLNPFAIRFTETFGVRWYGLAYAAGFFVAWMFIRWMAKSRRSPMTVRDVADLMLPAILGVLVGRAC
jgi:phosphatidylglycerol:prolipoprotein diacylglycerol transferase